MKKIIIFFVKIYQVIPGPWHHACRHIPSCSNYMIEAVEIHGVFKGVSLGIKRILRCNPLGTVGYDPVPKKGQKNSAYR